MNKRTLGKVLTKIGTPFGLSIASVYSGVNESLPIRTIVSGVATLLTLPLAPFLFKGEEILFKCDEEDFIKRTAHLPKVQSLGNDYARIEEDDDEFYVWPYSTMTGDDYEGVFDTEKEARGFLECQGYREVVCLNDSYTPHHLWGTFWIR